MYAACFHVANIPNKDSLQRSNTFLLVLFMFMNLWGKQYKDIIRVFCVLKASWNIFLLFSWRFWVFPRIWRVLIRTRSFLWWTLFWRSFNLQFELIYTFKFLIMIFSNLALALEKSYNFFPFHSFQKFNTQFLSKYSKNLINLVGILACPCPFLLCHNKAGKVWEAQIMKWAVHSTISLVSSWRI